MMPITPKNILAILGSTRKNATNYHLIKAIQVLSKDIFKMAIFEGIAALPHFNPDDNKDPIAATVIAFRQLLAHADGVIICTPEYAHGVPGTLKNAIDWVVSSNEFTEKPTALITASTDGTYAHQALLEILNTLGAKNAGRHQLVIPFAKTKINNNNTITDKATLDEILSLINNLQKTIEETIAEK
jgi:chromate reductase, NAD(P)H dehydrogenase (quinone)